MTDPEVNNVFSMTALIATGLALVFAFAAYLNGRKRRAGAAAHAMPAAGEQAAPAPAAHGQGHGQIPVRIVIPPDSAAQEIATANTSTMHYQPPAMGAAEPRPHVAPPPPIPTTPLPLAEPLPGPAASPIPTLSGPPIFKQLVTRSSLEAARNDSDYVWE